MKSVEVLEKTIWETRSQMAVEMMAVQIPARIHYNLESFVTFGHEAKTCLSAMANESRRTVVERATARNGIVAVMTKVTGRQNVEVSATAARTGSLMIVHRNVEALVGSSSTTIVTEIQGMKQNAAVVLLDFHACPTMAQDLNRPSRYSHHRRFPEMDPP